MKNYSNLMKKTGLITAVALSLPVLLYHYLTVLPGNLPAAAAVENDPASILYYRGSSPRFMVIPDVKSFLSALRQNDRVEKLLDSQLGRDFSSIPPVKALGITAGLLDIAPASFRWQVVSQLFPGGMYYVSTPQGFSLVFEVNRLGRSLISEIGSSGYSHALHKGYFILASNRQWLEEQKKRIESPRPSPAPVRVSAGSAAFMIAGSEKDSAYSRQKTGLLFAFYETLFPSSYISHHSVIATPGRRGIELNSRALIRENMQQRAAALFKKSAARLQVFDKEAGVPVLLESAVSWPGISAWAGDQHSASAKAENSTVLAMKGLKADYGLMLPDIAISWQKNGDRDLNTFLQNAFRYRNFIEENTPGLERIRFKRYSYGRTVRYYTFEPVLMNAAQRRIWATTDESRKKMLTILKTEKSNGSMKKFMRVLKRRPGESMLAALYMNIPQLISNSEKELSSISGVYHPDGFRDFKDALGELNRQLKSSEVKGALLYHQKYIRGYAQIWL